MTTWENASADVAREIRDTKIGGYGVPIDAVDNLIDSIKEGSIDQRAGLILIADEATTVYAVFADVPRAVALDQVLTTIAEKQADYGPQNILWAGVHGILLRMHDKTARIRNLQRRTAASNEPLVDSWLDLVGYAIVGIMLIDGTFEYPLARDMKPVEAQVTASEAVFEQLAADPGFAEAMKQMSLADSLPKYTTRVGDDRFAIDGGGGLTMHHEDGVTLALIQDGLGGYLSIAPHGDHIHLDANNLYVTSQIMAVICAMLLGAAEHSLDWHNTTMKAEVPNDE